MNLLNFPLLGRSHEPKTESRRCDDTLSKPRFAVFLPVKKGGSMQLEQFDPTLRVGPARTGVTRSPGRSAGTSFRGKMLESRANLGS